ncbi:type IV pilus assembly protein PilO [Fontibacillus panacisegetis]|uniref:Type IV pilus assembly protein PilO n=1 Tax=Fontibacillus panacisegetis TaxID=670482 RepID=A0A1G7J994_9BACL|nr:hypothetical protein [Fontibacillus panacisegetis]SDF21500.1 type IV pilus assembly protein PilO [Fontibacillus panacisegetis]
MRNMHNRSVLLLITSTAFLLLIIMYVWVYLPSHQQLSDLKAEKNRVNTQIETLQSVLDEKMSKKYNIDERVVQAAVPLWDNTEQLIFQLDVINKLTNVSVKNGSIGFQEKSEIELQDESSSQTNAETNGTSDNGVKEMVVNLTVDGKVTDVIEWVDRLEKLPRLIFVSSFNLKKGETYGDAVVDLSFVAFFDPSYEPILEKPILPKTSDEEHN